MTANHKLTAIIQSRVAKSVQQSDSDMVIQFEDGSTLHIKLAEATSSVMVRDRNNAMEYAD